MKDEAEQDGNRFHLFLRRLPRFLRGVLSNADSALTLREYLDPAPEPSNLDYVFGTNRYYDGIEFMGIEAPQEEEVERLKEAEAESVAAQ